jgi:sulfate adenylyltransferase subunit 1
MAENNKNNQKKPAEKNKADKNNAPKKPKENKPTSDVNKLQNNELLRLSTAGSVDDGKSTLIGRLLYDTKSVMKDQYEAVRATSKKKGEEEVNLAYLTDGLKSEREQGITIDVAYRYFNTANRKFIISDTPGHIQYTRNMITGASKSNVAIILVDARNGISEQTRRHSFIASLLKIPHVIYAVNKMDLIDYNYDKFNEIREQLKNFSAKLRCNDIRFIPISALKGDNVTTKSQKMKWYKGGHLLGMLENIEIFSDNNLVDARFDIQTVIRPHSDAWHDFRGYAGKIVSGRFEVGQKVQVLPSGFETRIKDIRLHTDMIEQACTPASVVMQLEDDIDAGRGDMIARNDNLPKVSQNIDAMICWMSDDKMLPRKKYILKHGSSEVTAMITKKVYTLDVNTFSKAQDQTLQIGLNDIARISIKTSKPISFDSFESNRANGSFILIDSQTNETVAAGMIK